MSLSSSIATHGVWLLIYVLTRQDIAVRTAHPYVATGVPDRRDGIQRLGSHA